MRFIKRVFTLFLTVCLLVSSFNMLALGDVNTKETKKQITSNFEEADNQTITVEESDDWTITLEESNNQAIILQEDENQVVISEENDYQIETDDQVETDNQVLIVDETNDQAKTVEDADLGLKMKWAGHAHEDTDQDFENQISSASNLYSLDSGSYYLIEDIDSNTDIYVYFGVEVSICLNGHVLNLNGNHIENYGTLSVYDCDDTTTHYFNIENDGLWTLSDNTTSNIVKGGVITGGFCEGDGDIAGNGGAIYNKGELSTHGVSFVGNKAESYGGAVALYAVYMDENNYSESKYNAYKTNFIGNIANNGGAIYVQGDTGYGGAAYGRLLLSDSVLKKNVATKSGALYNEGIVTLIGTQITNNKALQATSSGCGITNKVKEGCFIKGTQITMADGSYKNIEDISDGDEIRTFDHETGELSSREVIYTYASGQKDEAFILHFTDDTELGIAGAHCLLEQSSRKYEKISANNAEYFIGKKFYNADEDKWEELLSVTYEAEPYEYYSIYSAMDINCVANGMISVPDDADFQLNVFDMDETLKYDEEKKQADIEKYGLFTLDECEFTTAEEFENYKLQYVNVYIGKGLISYEQAYAIRQEGHDYYDNENAMQSDDHAADINVKNSGMLSSADDTQNSNQTDATYTDINVKNSGMLSSADDTQNNNQSDAADTEEIASRLLGGKKATTSVITCDTYVTDTMKGGTLIIGSNVKVNNNVQGTVKSNIYFMGTTKLTLIPDATGINAGITLSNGKGAFSTNGKATDVSMFSSDNSLYAVSYYSDIDEETEYLELIDAPDEPEETKSNTSSGSSKLITKKGWKKEGSNWRYYKSNGQPAQNEWLKIEVGGSLHWYHFGKTALLDIGWFLDKDGSWYYLDQTRDSKEGIMVTGWMTDPFDKYTYYLDEKSGKMATGWVEISGKRYHFNDKVNVYSGWKRNEKGDWIYEKQSIIPLGALIK